MERPRRVKVTGVFRFVLFFLIPSLSLRRSGQRPRRNLDPGLVHRADVRHRSPHTHRAHRLLREQEQRRKVLRWVLTGKHATRLEYETFISEAKSLALGMT